MQTQHYGTSLHHRQDFYHSSQTLHPASVPDAYLSQVGGVQLIDGFSRGSLTYPHPEYRYFSDRGTSSGLSSTSLAGTSFSATAMGFSGSPSSSSEVFRPEDISDYQQPWQWGGASTHRSQITTSLASDPSLLVPRSSLDLDSVVRAPAAQRPTPAAMAVLLNPTGQSNVESPRSAYEPPPPLALSVPQIPAGICVDRSRDSVGVRIPAPPDCLSREKKHGCTMCHKRFDRPSTLRKHLLVHTGEKAFVCETCGRRFGVASNLNRHVRRCILKPVNTPSSASNKSTSSSPPAGAPSPEYDAPASNSHQDPHSSHHPPTADDKYNKRGRRSSPSSVSTVRPPKGTHSQQSHGEVGGKPKPPPQKRRRRAPSPSKWIPYSLMSFNLVSEEFYKTVPVPLNPVRRNLPKEERDSWDENAGSAPYHPKCWTGILPGPGLGLGLGLGGKDVRNINLSGSGGAILGRVLVF